MRNSRKLATRLSYYYFMDYDYDDDDMELYEIECLREELYLDMQAEPYTYPDIEIDL